MAQQRAVLDASLAKMISAIEEHPKWKGLANPNPALYHVWDFVNRSKYMLSEFENIRTGSPVQFPDQFRPAPGKGDRAALKVFQDVCGRTMMTSMLITDTSGMTRMITGGASIDFGPACKAAAEELTAATPQEHMMAGMVASGPPI